MCQIDYKIQQKAQNMLYNIFFKQSNFLNPYIKPN